MFMKYSLLKATTSNHNKEYRRILFLALVLTLLNRSTSHNVQAAPLAVETRTTFSITISELPQPLCVGRDYDVIVQLKRQTEVKRGQIWVPTTPALMNSVTVKGWARPADIGTVTPRSQMTGWDVESDAAGEATYYFHAAKAGTGDLYFYATPQTSTTTSFISATEPIKVVNCKYTVIMNAVDVDSRDGVTIWTSGNLDTKITGDGGTLTGTGNFAFTSGFVGPPCSISYSEFSNSTTITGQVDDSDQLTLQFDYAPGTITSSVSCPEGGGSGSQQIDLTNTGIVSATFPANGGSRSFRFTYAGSDMAPGTMIIDVQPVEDEGGLSS
jgi:hypothetical protein